jgi:NADPH:quinone reductase-like Zn-dependent oxidoreductase
MLELLAAEGIDKFHILSHDLGGPPSVALAYMAGGRASALALHDRDSVLRARLPRPCRLCMKCLAHRGRHVVLDAAGEPHVRFDLRDFYHREGRLLWVDTLKLTLAESASILRQLAPCFASGASRPPAVETCPLAESPGAYARLHAGDVTGKLVVVP